MSKVPISLALITIVVSFCMHCIGSHLPCTTVSNVVTCALAIGLIQFTNIITGLLVSYCITANSLNVLQVAISAAGFLRPPGLNNADWLCIGIFYVAVLAGASVVSAIARLQELVNVHTAVQGNLAFSLIAGLFGAASWYIYRASDLLITAEVISVWIFAFSLLFAQCLGIACAEKCYFARPLKQ